MEANKVSISGHLNDISIQHPARNFIRHFVEMFVIMIVGMLAFATIFALIASIWGMTWLEGRDRFPQLFLLVITLGMTAPMVAWMRYRHHHTLRICSEMAAAMFIPGVLFIGLVSIHILKVGPACSLYCALMLPLTLIPMLLRRKEYIQDHRLHESQHQHPIAVSE